MSEPGVGAPDGGPEKRGQVEAWVRAEMSLPPEASVTLREAPGTDPRCSPVVTEVRVEHDGPPFVFHIERALGDVEEMDVVAAMAFGGGH